MTLYIGILKIGNLKKNQIYFFIAQKMLYEKTDRSKYFSAGLMLVHNDNINNKLMYL